ncbi:hypothetical protein GGI11_000431 [Coemansia sp. RSA 2049]|nr:hypothetical protein GGI11_000431 [Coemansia sp. RSA 2049]
MAPIPVGILTVSDKCSKGEAKDTSGPALAQMLSQTTTTTMTANADGQPETKKWIVVATSVVPDNKDQIAEVVRGWCTPKRDDSATGGGDADAEQPFCRLVIVTGGTGLSPSDVTVEAIEPLFTRRLPALATAMVVGSLRITPMAALSQVAAGVVANAAIVLAVPGSRKGATENVGQILPVLPHAVDTLMARKGTRHLHPVSSAAPGESTAAGKPMSHGRSAAAQTAPMVLCNCGREDDLAASGSSDAVLATGVSNTLGESATQRARKSPYPMVPEAAALSAVLSSVATMAVEPTWLALRDVRPGHVVAEDIVAQENVPAYAAAVMDGYAVVAADGPGTYAVRGASMAGSADGVSRLESGQIARIATGAPLPAGADAVVMVEDTEIVETAEGEEAAVRIAEGGRVRAGQNVRPVGHDLRKGAVVLRKGETVGTVGGEIAAMAVSGNRRFSVFMPPTVAVMSSGDEVEDVLAPGSADEPGALAYGSIRDCNRPALIAALRALGCTVVDVGVVRDDPDAIAQAMRAALASCHGIVTTGGVSMGERDWLKPVVEQRLRGRIRFGRVAMKPSKPTTFATVPADAIADSAIEGDRFVFALPGNPVSALVAFHMFVAPAVRLLSGHVGRPGSDAGDVVHDGHVASSALSALRPSVTAVFVGSEVELDRMRPEYVRASLVWNGGGGGDACGWSVRMVDQMQQSSRVASMQRANALVSLPRGTDAKRVVAAGELVTAIVIAAPHFG